MSATSKQPVTYADILEIPEHKVAEIVGGDLFVSPRPASRHLLASSVLGSELMGPFQLGRGGPGGWWIVDEPELHVGGDVVIPDLAGWCRERMPEFPDVPYFRIAPDWVCETLSPSTAKVDLHRKLPVYARSGVSHAWIVDPMNRAVQVFANSGERWTLAKAFADDERMRAEPFDEHEIELTLLWTGLPSEK